MATIGIANKGFSINNIKTNDEVIIIQENQGTIKEGPDEDKDNIGCI